MKKFVIAIVLSSAIYMLNAQTNPADAQSGPRQKQDPKVQTDKMTKFLGLSDDQKSKVLEVNTDANQKIQALSEKKSKGENVRGERKKIEQEREDKLKGILTVDQFNKFIERKTAMKQKHQQKREQNKNSEQK